MEISEASMKISEASTNKNGFDYSSGLPSSQGYYAPKQWMNYVTNRHL